VLVGSLATGYIADETGTAYVFISVAAPGLVGSAVFVLLTLRPGPSMVRAR